MVMVNGNEIKWRKPFLDANKCNKIVIDYRYFKIYHYKNQSNQNDKRKNKN